MRKLPQVALPKTVQTSLDRWQADLNNIQDYEERVDQSREKFKTRNTSKSKTFSAIRKGLTSLCSGARRCCYCEDSAADEVEHIKPKSLYPEQTFVWENYLYSCGPCNSRKNNNFFIFESATHKITNISRKKGDPVIPPLIGDSVFINPRQEDPFDFIIIDLVDTFMFIPSAQPESRDYNRAEYTINKILNLNSDLLLAARKESYYSCRARLCEYVRSKNSGSLQAQLDLLTNSLKSMQHPTVWQEIKRQQHLIPELEILFAQAPEALKW